MPIAGKLITFEGGEGAGKSTQISLLADRLSASGSRVVRLREPGGTPLGERMREVLKRPGESITAAAEALLFAACRAQLVAEAVAPALARGDVVLCDRFADSTTAYQSGGRGLDPRLIAAVNRLACGGVTPHLTVLLDLDPEHGLGRASVRDRGQSDRFEALDPEFHRRVRAAYLSLANEDPGRSLVLDAARPPAALSEDIWNEVARRLS